MKFIASIATQTATEGLPFLVLDGDAPTLFTILRQHADYVLLVRQLDLVRWDSFLSSLWYRSPFHSGQSGHYLPPAGETLLPNLIIVDDSTLGLPAIEDPLTQWVYAANQACVSRLPLDEAYWERSLAGKKPEPFVM